MINKTNWQLVKKYLEYRLNVDQISKGSLRREQTYIRYLLLWAGDCSFVKVSEIRPSFSEYMLLARLDGSKRKSSSGYIKKTLATARLFFSWLSDNEIGHRSIKQSWIKTIKAKRLLNIPKVREAVTFEEMQLIVACSVQTVFERRTRAALVFLYLSGMRIGAFVSLPVEAVDIANRKVIQYPSLGVKTKNQKFGITYLLDIPELLKVVQDWDREVRETGCKFWFAPLLPETGEIDLSVKFIGEHRGTLATKNIKAWMKSNNLVYHSPHKFRHGHIQYGSRLAKTIADYKAISLNVLHSKMETTDGVYSNLNDDEVQNRIGMLGKQADSGDDLAIIREFLEWKKSKNS